MRLRAALAAATLTLGLVAGPAAYADDGAERPCRDAPERPVRTGAVFNDPAAGDPTTVVREICNLVQQAPSGSQIRIAHFVISGNAGMDFATELIDAHRRGVDVQIVLDGWQVDNPAVDALRSTIGTDESQRSWLHVCSNLSPEGNTSACIGNKGQHNKFYLFSNTGGASDVVVQSSANFTDLNSTTYWNNAVTFVGNSELYRAYGSYFEDLAAEKQTTDYYRVTETEMRGGSVTSYFFPRASGDTIVDALAKVQCVHNTTIRIGMSEWDNYRIAIAERLGQLADDGCSISIVHGKMDDEVRQLLASAPSIETRELNRSDALPGRLHSKYMLIEGDFDGERRGQWVFTGSPNFNETSLRRNDEAMVRTDISRIYWQYRANFRTLYEAAG